MTFKAEEVVPYLVSAATDPKVLLMGAFEGYFGGVRDARLFNVLLQTREAWQKNSRSRRVNGDAILYQAVTDPTDPRLQDYVRELVGTQNGRARTDVLRLAKTVCTGHDCSWLRTIYVDAAADRSLWNEMTAVRYLAEQAPDRGSGFLRALISRASPTVSRERVAGLLLTTLCGDGSEGRPDPKLLEACLRAVKPGVCSIAFFQDAMSLLNRICRFPIKRQSDAGCWRSMRQLFADNDLVRSVIDIRLAGYMLESGEGSLDEAKSLLDHVNPEVLKPGLLPNYRYWNDRAKKKLTRLRWEEGNRLAAVSARLTSPKRLKGSGVWSITVTGPEPVLSRLGGAPITGFLWFRGTAGKQEPRSALFTLEESHSGSLRYVMTVDPYPDAAVLRHPLARVQLLFLGSGDDTPRLALSWQPAR